jgi:integrase
LTKLAEAAQVDVLIALKNGRVSIEELLAADREQRLREPDLLARIRLRANLWETVAATLSRLNASTQTRRRYAVSFKALRERASRHLGERATVADLRGVDWRALYKEWNRSAADWNHLRRAVSRFLSAVLADKHHSIRREVLRDFPIARERHRVPDISPEAFRKILDNVPDHARPSLIVLALTGMRVSEYLGCSADHLQSKSLRILVPGTKTAASAGSITIEREYWPWIERGIPSPLKYKWLRIYFKRACAIAGVPDARLHDLRHCFAQWGVEAGISIAKVQVALRHANPVQTRLYAEQRDTGEATSAVGAMIKRLLA